ncbi:MAG: hypothetical protein ACC649_01760 [Myxococcota bacterium]
MKGAEILEEVVGEIRVGNASEAATVAGASLRRVHGIRRVHGKIVNPVGIASEHRSPNPASPTRLRPLLDRPSDR